MTVEIVDLWRLTKFRPALTILTWTATDCGMAISQNTTSRNYSDRAESRMTWFQNHPIVWPTN